MATSFKMNLSQIIICIGIVLLVGGFIGTTTGQASEISPEMIGFVDPNTRHRVCGRHLITMLEILCKGEYYSLAKKSDDYVYMEPNNYDYDRFSLPPLYGGSRFLSAIHPRVRRHNTVQENNGIIDECCRKPCSLNEMNSYCRPDKN